MTWKKDDGKRMAISLKFMSSLGFSFGWLFLWPKKNGRPFYETNYPNTMSAGIAVHVHFILQWIPSVLEARYGQRTWQPNFMHVYWRNNINRRKKQCRNPGHHLTVISLVTKAAINDHHSWLVLLIAGICVRDS